nr:uncharacterized mitochondrial protein AtMg00810-like [Tanacetum cinerariifolium]
MILYTHFYTQFNTWFCDPKHVVGIKRLLDDLEVTAVKVCVTAAKQNLVLFSVETTIASTTVEEKAQRRLELKVRSTLLIGIPNEHQLKFNSIKDAKSLLQAVEKRNKHEIDTLSLDDLYSNLKIYKPEVKGTSSLNTNTQNVAFVSSNSTSNTNGAVNTAHDATTATTQATAVNSTIIDNLKEIDLRWKMAMLTIKARRFLKNTRMKFSMNGTRRSVPVETPASSALMSCDGISGYDWSDQAEKGPTNFALMAYSFTSSKSEVSTDSICSSSCLENAKILKEQNKQLLKDLRTSKLNAITYKIGLESIKARLLVYKKNESVSEEDIKVLKCDIQLREVAITELRRKLELEQKQKDKIQLIVEIFEISSKCLSKVIDCQIVDNLEEFVNKPIVSKPTVKKPVVETSESKASADKPKVVKKNFGSLLIEDWISDSKDEAESKPKIEKKTEKGVIDSGCLRHMTGNMSYLAEYKEIDGGYVAFGENPKGGKITGKCTIKTRKLDFKNVYFAEVVNTACYVQNRMLVVKPHNKTPYEFFHGRTPALSFIRPFGCSVSILNTEDHLGKFDGKADEGFFIGYSLNSKAFRVFNSRTRIVEENLHFRFNENTTNVVGSRPDWIFDIDALTRTKNYKPIVVDQKKEDNVNNTNNVNAAGANGITTVGANTNNELLFDPEMPALEDISTFNFSSDHEDDDEMADMNNLDTTIQVSPNTTTRIHKDHPLDQVIEDLHSTTQTRHMSKNLEELGGKIDKTLFIRRHKCDILLVQVYVDDTIFGSTKKELCNAFDKMMHEKFQMSFIGELIFFLGLQVKQKQNGIFISQDKYVAEILKKYRFTEVKNASTPIETQKPLLKDEDGEEVDVHMYRSMIGSLMYLTSSRPDIMFVVCACARYQVNPKVSHLYAMKRIFRNLKSQPKFGLWYPKDPPFDLVAYTDSDYAGESLDRKSTTGVNPTIYTSCIEQFWATVKVKTVIGEVQLQALVDGKKVIITESTVRRDLQLEDVEGVDCLPNVAIFKQLTLIGNIRRVGKGFSERETPLFSTMIIQAQEEIGKGSANLIDPHHTPTIIQPSTSLPQKKQKPRKTKRKDTELPQTSGPTTNIVDKVVNKEMDERVNTPQSDKDSLKLKELMELCTNLQNKILELENTKTTQALKIDSLKRSLRRSKAMKKVNTFVDYKTELVMEISKEAEAEVIEGSSKRAGEEHEQENAKKQKMEDNKEFAELKQCLEIIPEDGDDVTIDATLSLQQFKMLKDFDREDLEVLWRLVKAKFENIKPVNYMDNLLLHNLKTMFEHHVEDNI